MNRLVMLGVVVGLVGCGGGSDGTKDASNPGSDQWGNTDLLGQDQQVAPDGATGNDAASDALPDGGDPDTTLQDTHIEYPDLPPGKGQLGDPCTGDGDCESLLCWSTHRGSGCTEQCESQADCQAYGLACMWIREGVKACAPINGAVASQCTQSAQCPYPTVCLAEFNWCDLPECTFDKECPNQGLCKPGFRQCEPASCQSTYECKNPLEFCFDGACGAPKCLSKTDCGESEICNAAQGQCQVTDPCDAEGKCAWYNQTCVDGMCEPNLCVSPCTHAGDICDPKTGKCGASCSASSPCATGWGCALDSGVCYVNNPPVAVAKVEKGTALLDAITVPAGTTVKLVGHLSVDPEGKPLQYIWTLIDIPEGSTLTAGGPVSGDADATFKPPMKGLYQFGLRVQDETGIPSAQAQATVLVL